MEDKDYQYKKKRNTSSALVSTVVYIFTSFSDANMSYIDVTSLHLVTTAQEYLHATMIKKMPLYSILIHDHLVITLALVFLKYLDNLIMLTKPKIKKLY